MIEVTGGIKPGIVDKLRKAVANVDRNRAPAGAITILNSKGGDGIAAMEIGRMAHEAAAHAFVRGH